MADAPLIVTAGLDPASFERLDAPRRAHFPPERNHLRAHLTLFHALPGEEEAAVRVALAEAAAGAAGAIPFRVDRVLGLGRGVAYGLDAPALIALRADLAERWASWRVSHAAQPLRPHVTVQNKVAPEVARALRASLETDFAPWTGEVVALELWAYRGGPWEPLERWALGEPVRRGRP